MQSLIRDNSVIFLSWSPIIEIGLNEINTVGKTLFRRVSPAPFQHCRIQIDTVDNEVGLFSGAEVLSQANFQVAITRTNADKSRCCISAFAMLSNIFSKHVVRTAEPQRFEPWAHVAVRPVVKNIR